MLTLGTPCKLRNYAEIHLFIVIDINKITYQGYTDYKYDLLYFNDITGKHEKLTEIPEECLVTAT